MDIRRAQIPCNMRFLPIDTPKAKQPSCVMQEGCFAVKYGGAAAVFQLYFSPAAKSYIAPSARLCPRQSRGLCFAPLWVQSLGVPAVRAHFEGGRATAVMVSKMLPECVLFIEMCRDPRHTLTLPPTAAKHNPPEGRI